MVHVRSTWTWISIVVATVFITRYWMSTAAERTSTTVVVGSGLAGLTTTLQLLKKGVRVMLIEKTDKLGGNSSKASSGINGVPTRFQHNPDTVGAFYEDTLRSGKGLSNKDLVWELASRSEWAINWLTAQEVDLTKVTQLGGHSFARTHRGSGKLPPGYAIISALSKKLESYPPEQLVVMKKSRVTKLIVKDGAVNGVEVESNKERLELVDVHSVVLATGGYSADAELIGEYRADLLELPSTNGAQTTGDGQKIAARDVGAKLVHMDQVQVHPTGFINLADKTNKWKFLCGELLRGIGGILISPETGLRFVNELDTRDKVTSAMLAECPLKSSIILINSMDYLQARDHIDFYVSQGLLHRGSVGDMVSLLKKEDYDCAEEATFIATISEYAHSVTSGTDGYHRAHFGSSSFTGDYFYGLVTPVVHFSMGGVAINKNGRVLREDDSVVPNLYAAGEVSGGVHGGNRLGGSSLLECVVFGKIVSENISRSSH